MAVTKKVSAKGIASAEEKARVKQEEKGTPNTLRAKKVCFFCQNKSSPRYWDAAALRKYMSDRGRILNRARVGTCAKHQRCVGREIKRARHLALLPFTVRV